MRLLSRRNFPMTYVDLSQRQLTTSLGVGVVLVVEKNKRLGA